MPSRYMVRVLGPIDIETPDGAVDVGGHHARVVLGALAVSVGRTVPADRLIDLLWGLEPPECAQGTLQSYVSRLRSLLGRDAIRLVDHGYVFDAGPDELDALRFEERVRSAVGCDDPMAARAACHDALSMWRGVPFGDLADRDPFRLEAIRLDELRLVAMETQIDADIRLGHSDLVTGALEAAVQENPYRERLWHLLVEALAQQGRRVEALRACSDLRRILVEVGLEPGEDLARLEQQILRGEPV